MRTQTIIWSPLPNGRADASHLSLSVHVAPQLQTDEGGSNPRLTLFPDWENWPKTVASAAAGPLSFRVTFSGFPAVTVTPTLSVLESSKWAAVFDPSHTRVDSYTYTDYSTHQTVSFPGAGVHGYLSNLYGQLGAASPTGPIMLQTLRGIWQATGGNKTVISTYQSLLDLTNPDITGGNIGAVGDARAFHTRPAGAKQFKPATPVLDFHQGIAAAASFPQVLEIFGLVFRLRVPIPSGLGPGTYTVTAQPVWHSSFTGASGRNNVDVALPIEASLTSSAFRPVPAGPDYGNGMLDLADTSRFSVVDLDVDGASESVTNLSVSLKSLGSWVHPYEQDGQQLAVTTPALRSVGPSIFWSGWGGTGSGLNALAAGQTAIQNQVANWVSWDLAPSPKPPEPALPLLHAEDVIRGHRFDVHTQAEPTPAWRSLHQRRGSYRFGTGAATGLGGADEGTVVPGATQPSTPSGPLPSLYVHEAIARWAGWSLSAPRVGPTIDPTDHVDDNPTNPASSATDSHGNTTAQLSANFTVVPKSLPKLRFGRAYQYRARAVDLGGWSLPVSSTDASTATPATTHYRYEPVPPPTVVPTDALGAGESVLLLVIRNEQTSAPVPSNGRWLLPPKASEMLIEEHGMLDGYVPGHHPDPHQAPTPAAYTLLADRVDRTTDDLAGVRHDGNNHGAPYMPVPASGTAASLNTPWLADPLAAGVTLTGLPGGSTQAEAWRGGIWPTRHALLLELRAGTQAGHHYTAPSGGKTAVETVTLPPAAVADVVVSSNLAANGLDTLGVWSWIEANLPAAQKSAVTALAKEGLLWMLTPTRLIRLVHAVRLPLRAPAFHNPVVRPRDYGSTQAIIEDTAFVIDRRSTASVDVEAAWSDPLDDPSDPSNDPTTAVVKSSGHAFKLHVPDPAPIGAPARPMQVVPPEAPFALSAAGGGAVHSIGDTKHHEITYRATGTSRFAEMFRRRTVHTFTSASPVDISGLGLDPAETTLTVESSGATVPTSAYTIDATHGRIAVTSASYRNRRLVISWVPTDTRTGAGKLVHVLASARPAAPQVVKVTPAWAIGGPAGKVESGGISYQRAGGYLRVYLDRPWHSSGPGELLGVIAVPPPDLKGNGNLPAGVQPGLVTMMGLDPISVSSLTEAYPVSPTGFKGTTTVPAVPYRPAYSSPPQMCLVEDPGGPLLAVWPFEVHYDKTSELWFADVGITVGTTNAAPPPGYFVRLALVRFQPYAFPGVGNVFPGPELFPGAEISTVTTATFAQPVSNRAVSVTKDTADPTQSVTVTVTGPAYYGYRPATDTGVQWDYQNPYALHPHSDGLGARATSAMVVEVQVQDTSKGLTGDLAWTTPASSTPFVLEPGFSGGPAVTWTSRYPSGAPGGVKLPHPLGTKPMRLRVSEVDYPTSAPAAVSAATRRPFVAFIPLS
ncbi:MAG TPA: hypothetical protein VKV06_14670 [Acidimicrobiales bacterium]|nr:hypothetical protein [Acidimicrobiales bacterium]